MGPVASPEAGFWAVTAPTVGAGGRTLTEALLSPSVPVKVPSTGCTVYCQVPIGTAASVHSRVAAGPEIVPAQPAAGATAVLDPCA